MKTSIVLAGLVPALSTVRLQTTWMPATSARDGAGGVVAAMW